MKKRDISLDILRVIAITLVILLHVIFLFRNKYFMNNNSYFMLFTWIDSFTRVGVPIFLMLTGILLLNKKEEYTSFIKKRVPRLLINYIIFSILYILYDVIIGNKIISVKDAIQIILSKQAAYHLWYLPLIIMIYLLIPFIQKLVQNLTKEELKRIIITIFLCGNLPLSVSIITARLGRPLLDNFCFPNLLIYINYLLIGYYLYQYRPKMNKKHILLAIISVICIPLLTYYISEEEINDFFLNALSPFVVCLSILVTNYFIGKKIRPSKILEYFYKSVSSVTLHMYLVHVLIISIINQLLYTTIMKAEGIENIILMIGIFVITWILSYGISILIKVIKKWIINKKDLIVSGLIKLFSIGFVIVFSYCTISLLMNKYHFTSYRYPLLLLSCILICGLFYILYKYQKVLFQNKTINRILIAFYIMFQLLILYCYAVRPTWDFGTVYYLARDVASNKVALNNVYYLYICDNNIPLASFFSGIFKILYSLHLDKLTGVVSLGINLIAVDISFIYFYKIIDRINHKISTPCLIMSLFFSPLVLYLPIFYSDTLSLPFVCIPLYYYLKYVLDETKKSYLVIAGLLFGIGILLKATVGILVIAIVLVNSLQKNISYKSLSFLLLFVLIIVIMNKVIVNVTFSKEEMNRSKKPMTHFIMMGLQNEGGFSEEDLQFTTKIPTYAKKKEKTIEKIKERLYNYYRNHKLVDFYLKKINYTWADGTFYADKALGLEFYHQKYQKYIQSYYKESWVYFNMANAEWIMVLSLMIVGFIFRKYLSDKEKMIQLIINMSILGLFIFLLIWETRSRYLVNYCPLFLISGYLGLNAVINYLKEVGVKVNEK